MLLREYLIVRTRIFNTDRVCDTNASQVGEASNRKLALVRAVATI